MSDPLGFVWTVSTRRDLPFDSTAQAAAAILALFDDGPTSRAHGVGEAVELAYDHDAAYLRAVRARLALAWTAPTVLQRLCLERLASAADIAAVRSELGDPPCFLLLWLLGLSRPPSCHPGFAQSLADTKVSVSQLDAARDLLAARSPATLALIELDFRAVRRLLVARP